MAWECSNRWEEVWPQISERLRQEAKERSVVRRCKRKAAKAQRGVGPAQADLVIESMLEAPMPVTVPQVAIIVAEVGEKPVVIPRRPATNHPWRHLPIGRARRAPHRLGGSAKT